MAYNALTKTFFKIPLVEMIGKNTSGTNAVGANELYSYKLFWF